MFFVSCGNKKDFEQYCFKLIEQSVPGYYTAEFTDNNKALSPEIFLVYSYNQLISKWKHIDEIEGEDIINSAEDIFGSSSYEGDCEDLAVCVMAFCRERNIDAFFCFAKNKRNKKKGHVWVEVPICTIDDYNNDLREKINKISNYDVSAYTKSDIVWLRFTPAEKLQDYKLQYKLDIDGNIFKY